MRCVRQILDQLETVDDPLPDWVRREHGLIGLDEALRRIHLPDDRDDVTAARERLRFDEAAAVQLVLARRRHDVAVRTAPGVPAPQRRYRRRVRSEAAVRTDRRPARRRGRDRGRPRRRASDESVAAGRGRFGQDDRGAAGHAAGHRRGAPVRAARPDRSSRRPACAVADEDARRPRRGGRTRCPRTGHEGHPRDGIDGHGPQAAGPARHRERRLGARDRHPRADPAGRRVPRPRARRRRRTTPLRGGAARRAAQPRPRRCQPARAGDDGDTDPAHHRDDRPRRPRGVHIAGTAPRPVAHHQPGRGGEGASELGDARLGTHRRGGRGGPAGVCGVLAHRRRRQRRGRRPRRRRRRRGGDDRRAQGKGHASRDEVGSPAVRGARRGGRSPICGSGCCTGACPPTRRTR